MSFKKNDQKKDFFWAFSWAAVFTAGQILVCLMLASRLPETSETYFEKTYLKLFQWDSLHYQSIVEEGYHLSPEPITPTDVHLNHANAGFFPAYPIAASFVKYLFGLKSPHVLIATAQIFCFLFWVEVLLLLRVWGVGRKRAQWISFNIVLFPSSFFLVAGYSESLFLAALLGMIWGIERLDQKLKEKRQAFFVMLPAVAAVLAGMTLTATRLVGVPLMGYPIFRFGSRRPFLAMALAAFIGLGGGLFFLWCEAHLGRWDIYLRLQQLGWGNVPNYLAILDPRSYLPRLFFEDSRNSLCRASNLVILVFSGILLFKKERSPKNVIRRAGLYFTAAVIFYISLSGKANYEMDSMIRYNFPVWVLLWLSFAQMTAHQEELFPRRSRLQKVGLSLTVIAIQLWMIHLFTKGAWVA